MAEEIPPPPKDAVARLSEMVDRLVESYDADARTQHIEATFLPNRAKTIELVELLRKLVFPGFFDEHRITRANIRFHAGELLNRIYELLYEQVRQALRYELNRQHGGRGDTCERCDEQAVELSLAFLDQLPDLRRLLATDVQTAFDGDPAAASTDEAIFCYPGIDAIFIHRVAHALWNLGVPLLPRIISEYAHNETGIDIHPGATIGESFFIDHGTGVVMGETTVIGNRVKIYQGVTLGALSTKGGQAWRGRKRHPTIEDDVTIYGGAIILGGETVIGRGSTIGGAVFLTSSVPAGHTVNMKKPELRVSANRRRRKQPAADSQVPPHVIDFQI
ncbi:MAG: serine O-acetyltransferase [Phycisphaeraceae bacterium]